MVFVYVGFGEYLLLWLCWLSAVVIVFSCLVLFMCLRFGLRLLWCLVLFACGVIVLLYILCCIMIIVECYCDVYWLACVLMSWFLWFVVCTDCWIFDLLLLCFEWLVVGLGCWLLLVVFALLFGCFLFCFFCCGLFRCCFDVLLWFSWLFGYCVWFRLLNWCMFVLNWLCLRCGYYVESKL